MMNERQGFRLFNEKTALDDKSHPYFQILAIMLWYLHYGTKECWIVSRIPFLGFEL